MEELKSEKLNLSRSFEEKLKLFMFIVRPMPHNIIYGESIGIIVSYRIEDAMKKAANKYAPKDSKKAVTYTGNFVEIAQLVAQLKEGEMEKVIVLPGKTNLKEFKPGVIVKPNQPILTISSFKNCLMLAADEFIKNEVDKKELKRIINTIENEKQKHD